VLVEDIFASEQSDAAEYQDRWEKLRDPSHARVLAAELNICASFREAGLETDAVKTFDDRARKWSGGWRRRKRPGNEPRRFAGSSRKTVWET